MGKSTPVPGPARFSERLECALKAVGLSPRAATIALCIVYILIWAFLPPGGYFSGDQGTKYAQIEALARHHSLAVGTADEPLSVRRPEFSNFYRQLGNNYYGIF